MIEFDCTVEEKDYTLKPGDKVIVEEDIFYCTKEDCDPETYEDYKYFMREEKNVWGNPQLYIPKGTVMRFEGNKYNCWPTFVVAGEELEFATDIPLKLNKLEE